MSRESLTSSPARLVPSLSAPSWCLFFLFFFFSVGAEQAFLETEGQVVTSTCSTESRTRVDLNQPLVQARAAPLVAHRPSIRLNWPVDHLLIKEELL